MKSIAIRNNYKLEQHQRKLHFDELPLVVAYIRYGHDSNLTNLPGPQMASILRMLTHTFGQYSFNVIWVIEESTGSVPIYRDGLEHGQYREGLTLVTQLLNAGYGKYLAVCRLDRLTRSYAAFEEMELTVLKPHGVELLVVPGPGKGPGHSPDLSSAAPTTRAGGDIGGEQDE